MADHDDVLDYEDEKIETTAGETQEEPKKDIKLTYDSIHSSGFRDFLLKPEILRAIVDCSFEHPSEVQHECIPQAVLGMDILCQAKSGMGKTAVFVLATLQQLQPSYTNACHVLIMCHTHELAFQISKEYGRFSKYMPTVKVAVFFGGLAIQKDEETLMSCTLHIVVLQKRILMATNLFGRGLDIERVNIVFNYDMPEDPDTYLHRMARVGPFGTKGLAITFVSDENDAKILNKVQDRFDVNISSLLTLRDAGAQRCRIRTRQE